MSQELTTDQRDTVISEIVTVEMQGHCYTDFQDEDDLYSHCMDEGRYDSMDDEKLLDTYRASFGKSPRF